MDSSLININSFTQLGNANMVIFAKLDSEKSLFLKPVTSCLLSTCNVYAIDPGTEYQAL